jgi:AAA+ ATPase superfamily predicted ATPase
LLIKINIIRVGLENKGFIYYNHCIRRSLICAEMGVYYQHFRTIQIQGGAGMIGRKEEQRLLRELAKSNKAEFVVIYGRRRVGKTYLVNETFKNNMYFSYSGIANVKAHRQIEGFTLALKEQGYAADAPIKNWFDVFNGLKSFVLQAKDAGPKIIFIDEKPWMDNRNSEFVPALEHFWNGWAANNKSIKLVVCGSATAWISNKIFRNQGGLYNRVTRQIALKPFTLLECRQFIEDKGVRLSDHDIVEGYMIFGGIPFYLDMFDKKYSLAINVDKLCFSENAPLREEYDRIFDTLFAKSEKHEAVVRFLSSKKMGRSREDIATHSGIADGGNITKILKELAESGLIRKYKPFGGKKNGALYQLTDPFIGFHLSYIDKVDNENYWSAFFDHAAHRAWSGYAFEQVCLAHIPQIKKALGISGVLSDICCWRSQGEGKGAQIDLVIDRNDNIINLCEMKYSRSLYKIDAKADAELRHKISTFSRATSTKKAVHLTMVTTFGLENSKYNSIIQSEVTMRDLFAE